jgi:hypothetical protein
MTGSSIVAGLGLATVLAAAPGANSEPVIVTPTLAHGDLNEAVAERLEDSLREAVRKSDIRIVKVPEKLARRAADCQDDKCRAGVLAKTDANFLLVPEVTLVDKDYHMRLTLYGASGSKTARLEETCSLCGLVEAAELMADLGARMGRKVDLATRAAFVEIRSEPAGAKVYVEGELVGTTPLELPLDAGAHHLRIEMAGRISLRRRIDVVAGEATMLDFQLQRLPPKSARDRKLFTGLGWAGFTLGLVAVTGGAALIRVDEKPITSDCSGENVDFQGNCRWRYDTLEGGISLVASGALLIGTGVALLVVGRDKFRMMPLARVTPTLGGFAVRF